LNVQTEKLIIICSSRDKRDVYDLLSNFIRPIL